MHTRALTGTLALTATLMIPRAGHGQTQNAPPTAKHGAEAAVIENERQAWEAIKAGNAREFIRLGWGRYTDVEEGGAAQVTPKMLEGIMKSCSLHEYSNTDEQTTMPAPDVVVLTYRNTNDMTCDGKKGASPLYMMSVYRKGANGWQAVAHAEVPVKAETPAAQQGEAPTSSSSDAATIAGLRYQWLGFLTASVTNARARGQSPAEFGASLGHIIGASWPKDASPQMIGHAMADNFNLVGQKTTVVEETPDRVVLRIARTDSASFARDIAPFGSTVDEYEATLRGLLQAATSDRGLAWDERRDGDTIVATVTRKK